jgi:hypothetical protein
MNHNKLLFILAIMMALFLLAGCDLLPPPRPVDDGKAASTNAVLTVAAMQKTLEMQITQTADVEVALPLTQTAVIQEFIAQLTQTAQAQPTLTKTPEPPTLVLQTLTPLPSTVVPYYPTLIPQPCDRAIFVMDTTYPDYSQVNPGQTFSKIWRVQNIGTCTWTPDYAIINQQTGQTVAAMVNVPIPPGGSVDVSVSITTPWTPGIYQISYLFRSRYGSVFGVGSDGITPVWARVTVGTIYPTVPPIYPTVPYYPTVYPDMIRILFPPGGSVATFNDSLGAGEIDRYVMYAHRGQQMKFTLTSTKNRAVLSIYGMADGNPLVNGEHSGATSWEGTSPYSQDYAISVISTGKSADYSLKVEVSPIGPTPPQPQRRTRIQFDKGAISASIRGGISARGADYYVLRALKGQKMTVELDSQRDHSTLTIYGKTDGKYLVRGYVTGENSFSGILPLTQDYAFDILSDGNPASYTLNITIK